MVIADIIVVGATCLGSIVAVAKLIESSFKKFIKLETEPIRNTLVSHTEKLRSIEEQTKKTNGRVNKHDDRLLDIDKYISAESKLPKGGER